MKYLMYLIGPTVMILVGLHVFNNVILTFLLFYVWLLAVPLISKVKVGYAFKGKSLWLGLFSGLLFFTFIFGGLFWLHSYFIDLKYLQRLLEEWGFSGKATVGLIFVLLVINPILEEVYWREFMFEKLKLKVSATYSIMITSFFYTLYHFLSVIPMFNWPLNVVAVFPVFLAGIFWGYVREKSGSIIGTIISHLFADLGIMCVYWFIVRQVE